MYSPARQGEANLMPNQIRHPFPDPLIPPRPPPTSLTSLLASQPRPP